MTEETRETFWRRNNPIMWGVLATISVFVFGSLAAFQPVCQTDFWGNQTCGESKWVYFLNATPNEVGDTLAGFAGALAFVWLIATVWLQGQELAEQRKELREQRKATQDMAKAQLEQVKLLQMQGKIFEDEQRQREETRAGKLLDQQLEGLSLFFQKSNKFHISAVLTRENGTSSPHQFSINVSQSNDQELSRKMEDLRIGLVAAVNAMRNGPREGLNYSNILFESFSYGELERLLEDIVVGLPELSKADVERVRNHKIQVVHRFYDMLLTICEKEAAQ